PPPQVYMDEDDRSLSWVWLLGRDGYQRLCLRFWVMTSCVYAVLLALQAYAVSVGLIQADHALLIRVTVVGALATFYIFMRSGWNRRFDDPALTVQQMAFALAMLAMTYVLMPQLRGTLLITNPLVLMFGAFTLSPRQCRQIGVFAVLMQAVAMLFAMQLQMQDHFERGDGILFVSASVVFLASAEMAGRLSATRQQLRQQKRELRFALERNASLARQDELTSLPNRRHATEMMEYESRRAQRNKLPPSVCMVDIDHFKRINDTYGHAAGDAVLRTLASHAVAALRGPDILARWGGEEFILIMPETSLDEAFQVVERLRQVLAHTRVWQERPELQITFSAGIAVLQETETIRDTVLRADAALYRAKQQGRNRTVSA
ncbi:MAG: diguanylate cyclase, partial [Rhodoferax sp.]